MSTSKVIGTCTKWFLLIMMGNDIQGWMGPKFSRHLSYGCGKTPEKYLNEENWPNWGLNPSPVGERQQYCPSTTAMVSNPCLFLSTQDGGLKFCVNNNVIPGKQTKNVYWGLKVLTMICTKWELLTQTIHLYTQIGYSQKNVETFEIKKKQEDPLRSKSLVSANVSFLFGSL